MFNLQFCVQTCSVEKNKITITSCLKKNIFKSNISVPSKNFITKDFLTKLFVKVIPFKYVFVSAHKILQKRTAQFKV